MEKRRVFVERFGEGNHHKKQEERHDHRPPRGPKPPRPPRPPRDFEMNMTTKLITSKEELVAYVNELGEKGHFIDIFKIEDGLYKVVVKERKHKEHSPRPIHNNLED